MREIKFRGVRTDNGELVYGYYVKSTGSELGLNTLNEAGCRICHVIVVNGEFFHVDPESVGQYTGLKDKNGREIYEGDILQEERVDLFEVVWDLEWAEFKLQGLGRYFRYPDWNRGRKMEIIGNRYENPELLSPTNPTER